METLGNVPRVKQMVLRVLSGGGAMVLPSGPMPWFKVLKKLNDLILKVLQETMIV